jgi:hypothetical protein
VLSLKFVDSVSHLCMSPRRRIFTAFNQRTDAKTLKIYAQTLGHLGSLAAWQLGIFISWQLGSKVQEQDSPVYVKLCKVPLHGTNSRRKNFTTQPLEHGAVRPAFGPSLPSLKTAPRTVVV